MYAVIRTGSKQYRVTPGDVITVEKLGVAEGDRHSFDDVLLYHDGKKAIVNPKELAKVSVSAEVVGQGRSGKLVVYKYRPKKGYRRKRGHRQELTRVRIEDIAVGAAAPAARRP